METIEKELDTIKDKLEDVVEEKGRRTLFYEKLIVFLIASLLIGKSANLIEVILPIFLESETRETRAITS